MVALGKTMAKAPIIFDSCCPPIDDYCATPEAVSHLILNSCVMHDRFECSPFGPGMYVICQIIFSSNKSYKPVRGYGSRGHHITQKGIYTAIKPHLFLNFFLSTVWQAITIILALYDLQDSIQIFTSCWKRNSALLQVKDLLMVCVHVKNCFFSLNTTLCSL